MLITLRWRKTLIFGGLSIGRQVKDSYVTQHDFRSGCRKGRTATPNLKKRGKVVDVGNVSASLTVRLEIFEASKVS